MALEGGGVLHAVLLHERLAARTRHPVLARNLVAADVDVLRREKLAHFVKNLFVEFVGLRVRRADDFPENARLRGGAATFDLLLAFAVELGIDRDDRVGMPRHFNLGHDRDVALRSVIENLADLRLRVEERAVGLAVVPPPAAAPFPRRWAPGAVLRKIWIGVDLDAPALVVGEVPVQHVHFVERHLVEKALDLVDAEEVAAFVEEKPPPMVARGVANLYGGEGVAELAGRARVGGELAERLDGVEEACGIARLDPDRLRRHGEDVPLALDLARRRRERNRGLARVGGKLAAESFAEEGRRLLRARRLGVERDGHVALAGEDPALHGDFLRQWNDVHLARKHGNDRRADCAKRHGRHK